MCLALRASGLWLRYATLQNWIPSFPWIAPSRPPLWRNPRKGKDQILPSGNTGKREGNRLGRRRHASESCPAAGMIASTLKRRSQTTQQTNILPSSSSTLLNLSFSLQVHPHFSSLLVRFCLYTYGRKLGRRLGTE